MGHQLGHGSRPRSRRVSIVLPFLDVNMFKPRNAIILVLGLVLGCNFIPADLSQLCPLGDSADPQSVQDVTPGDISDPDSPALNSPAVEGDPIRVRLSNPTNRDADCVVTMELIGREVHLSTRRIIASTDSLIIGPDRADAVRIEATFLGDPPIAIIPTDLKIYQDYQPGDTIEYVLELPADDSQQEQPPDDDQNSDNPPPPPDDEVQEPPTGACCLSGGPCEITAEADCTDGLWLGEDTTCADCPECLVICPADATDENEPCGEDTNGGCFRYPEQFTPIACDETICATSWSDFADPNEPNDPNAYPPSRLEGDLPFDTDWYELNFDETTEFTFTVATEFPIFVMLMKQYDPGSPGCEDLTGDVAQMAYSMECGIVTLNRCVESGTYYILVHAAFEYSQGIYLDCEGQNHYTATLTCTPCDYVAACCVEGDCVGDTTEAECLSQGGTWHYWGRCEDFVCPPINDECENAIQIGEVTDLAFDTSSATEGTPDECMYSPNIWYCYTATNTGPVVISLCGSSYDTMLAVYDGCGCGGEMSRIECNDDTYECGLQSQIVIDAYAGQTYLIEVGGYAYDSGAGVLNIYPLPGACCVDSTCVATNALSECNELSGTWYAGEDCGSFQCPPINDECENAIQIGEVTDLAFDTSSANAGTLTECIPGPNIWYCYTSTNTGPMVISLCGSSYDTMLAVYDGCDCSGEMVPLKCNDDTDECGLQSQIVINAYADQTYMIEVGGSEYQSGAGVLNIYKLPGACCIDNSCVVTSTLTQCNELGGTWYAGEDCDSFQCPPPCPESELTITIVPDEFSWETTWEIFDPNSAEPVCSGGPFEYANIPYTYTCCIGAEDCVDFTIYDSYGDGIYAPGGYSIALDGIVLYNCIGSGWGEGGNAYQETFWDIGGGCIFYGACCFGGGDCSILTEDECNFYDGFYQGDNTSCDPNPCPQPPEGACCTWDGVCEFVTEAECNQMEGTYQGDDIPCDPDPCLPPFGACCVGDGVCEMLTDMDCYKFGGEFMGDGVECDPNPCPIP